MAILEHDKYFLRHTILDQQFLISLVDHHANV